MSVVESADTSSDAPLYPPTVQPPDEPLPIHKFLLPFVRNPIRTIPRGAYEEAILVANLAGNMRAAWINDPALVEKVLLNKEGAYRKLPNIEKRILGPVLGDGVLIAEGESWRWQRRTLAPLFRYADLLSYVPVMTDAAEELVRSWSGNDISHDVGSHDVGHACNGTRTGEQQQAHPGSFQVRDIEKAMSDVTFTIIARTMLADGEPAEAETIKRAAGDYLAPISWPIAYALLNLPDWLPHPGSWRMFRARRTLRRAVSDILANARKREHRADDLLNRLSSARDPESGVPMPDEQIINNVLTLLEAGHETTAKALTWTLYLLARAPEWQTRVRDEVRRVAGTAPISPDHMELLKDTEHVIKEAMRLYPPVSVVARTPTKPVELGGYQFDANDQCLIPIYSIHRHRRLWSDPDCFDPSRFAPDQGPDKDFERHRTQYMPFGAGPRICIGATFAMLEAKAILATLVRRCAFTWDGVYEPEPVSRITLRPAKGMALGVRAN